MSLQPAYVLYAVVAVDLIVYLLLMTTLFRNRRSPKTLKTLSSSQAFAFFEKTYRSVFPEDHTFTWMEAASKASGIVRLREYEWDLVQKCVRQYEAYRYGEIQGQVVDTKPILKLALSLRKKN